MQKNNDKNNFMPKSQAYLFMLIAFVAGFFLATVVMSGQEVEVEKRVLGSGSSEQSNVIDKQTMQRISSLELDLAKNPRDAEKWTNLGNLYYSIPMPLEAIAAYQECLKLQPENLDVMVDMGTMYRANNEFTTAISHYDKALSINPRHQNARFNRGIVLFFDLGQKEEALNSWKILVQQNPQAKIPSGQLLSDFIKEQEQNN